MALLQNVLCATRRCWAAAAPLLRMPRSRPRVKKVDFCGHELNLRLKRTSRQGSEYKGVTKVGNSFQGFVTRNGTKHYLGSYDKEYDCAVVVAFAIKNGVEYLPSPRNKKVPVPATPITENPLMGINDEEGNLKSPESIGSPLFPIDVDSVDCVGNAHKSLMESWAKAHGRPFEPTPRASSISIPNRVSPPSRSRSRASCELFEGFLRAV